MNRNALFSLPAAALLALATLGASAPAQAGDVSNAQLSCFVDTYAFDYGSVGYCASYWTPSGASNPTTAVFEVIGLTAGNYTFTWKDLETGATGVCSSGSASCFRSISLFNYQSYIEVTVRDTDTGATRTVEALAEYYDGWN